MERELPFLFVAGAIGLVPDEQPLIEVVVIQGRGRMMEVRSRVEARHFGQGRNQTRNAWEETGRGDLRRPGVS